MRGINALVRKIELFQVKGIGKGPGRPTIMLLEVVKTISGN